MASRSNGISIGRLDGTHLGYLYDVKMRIPQPDAAVK
jgi:hypothetical protein